MPSCWSEPDAKNVYVMCIISVIITLLCFIMGVFLYMESGSSLCLVFGLENLVDFTSSVIVLWRFYVPSSLTDQVEKELEKREERASIAISLILGLLGFGVLFASIDDLMRGDDHMEKIQLVMGLSFVTIITNGSMSLFKFNYAAHLRSSSLFKDGVCSLIGTILALALFFNSLIVQFQPSVWWIDPIISLACGFAALFLGSHAIYQTAIVHGTPIYSLAWWNSTDTEKSETATVEMSGPAKESEIL